MSKHERLIVESLGALKRLESLYVNFECLRHYGQVMRYMASGLWVNPGRGLPARGLSVGIQRDEYVVNHRRAKAG